MATEQPSLSGLGYHKPRSPSGLVQGPYPVVLAVKPYPKWL